MSSVSVRQPQLPSNPKGEDWRFFIRQFESYCTFNEVDASQGGSLLELCIGCAELDILDGLLDTKADYSDILDAMKNYFKIHSSVLLRRREFLRATQGPSESANEFACRLRRLVEDCVLIHIR